MSANKKRHRLPKEDLAATVADIINSPITRSNLSFLRPLAADGLEDSLPKDGQVIQPSGLLPSPSGVNATPTGDGVFDASHGSSSLLQTNTQPIMEAYGSDPAGTDVSTSGLSPTPMGLRPSPLMPEDNPIIVDYPSRGLSKPELSDLELIHPASAEQQSWTPVNRPQSLWQAEGVGTVFEQTRVRLIHQAQDALSLTEEKVYDLLWGPKNQKRDEFRLVHYSLQRIATEARINIKTVRELIPRLVDKGFIAIEHEADVRRNIPTLYRVSSYTAALKDQKRKNRAYVTKTGKGVFYVHPVSVSFTPSEPMGYGLQPNVGRPLGDGLSPLGRDLRPEGPRPIAPLGHSGPKPMEASGSPYIDSLTRQTTTTTYLALVSLIKDTLGVEPDEVLLRGMIAACHRNSFETIHEAATDEELVYFTTTKARVLSRAANIRNHLAVLRKAVPECFMGETFRAYRTASAARKEKAIEHEQRAENDRLAFERERTEQEAQYALWATISERHKAERGYDMRAIADDDELDDRGKQQARAMLERMGRFTRSGL